MPDASWWRTRPGNDPARDRRARDRRRCPAALSADPPFARTGSMLMRPRHRRVHTDIPGNPAFRIGKRLQHRQNPRPHPRALPPPEQPIHRLPRPITRRHVPPRRAHAHTPPNPVDELPFRPLRRTPGLRTHRQQGLDQRPLLVGQIRAPRSRYADHEVSGIQVSLGKHTFYRRPHPHPAVTHTAPQPLSSHTRHRRTHFLNTA